MMSLFDSFKGLIAPPGAESGPKARVEKHSDGAFMPSATAIGAASVLLFAEFSGPRGRETGARFADALGRVPGIDVYRRSQVLALSGKGALVDQMLAAAEQGQGWLAEVHADLLLWGEVSPTGAAATVRFLSAADHESPAGAFGLGDALELPLPPTPETEAALVAVALAAAARAHAGSRERLVGLMRDAIKAIQGRVEPPAGMESAARAAYLNCVGNALATDFVLGGAAQNLDRAIACYRAAVETVSPATAPVPWALAQHHLADALLAADERDRTAGALDEAAGIYRTVAESLSRVDHPTDWALAQIKLGQVLYRLGVREGRASHFRASATAYEQALTIYTRDKMPGRWAELMNNYGVLMLALGEQVTGTQPLEQAADAFRKSLEVRKRHLAPILWAQTANNLGAATFALAKRNGNRNLLHEAGACFQGAIEIYRDRRQSAKVSVIEKNLDRVQRLLANRG